MASYQRQTKEKKSHTPQQIRIMKWTNHFVPNVGMCSISSCKVVIEQTKYEVAPKTHHKKTNAPHIQVHSLFSNSRKSEPQSKNCYEKKTKDCHYKTQKVDRLKQKTQPILPLGYA